MAALASVLGVAAMLLPPQVKGVAGVALPVVPGGVNPAKPPGMGVCPAELGGLSDDDTCLLLTAMGGVASGMTLLFFVVAFFSPADVL